MNNLQSEKPPQEITIDEVNGMVVLSEKIFNDLKPIFELEKDDLNDNLPQKITEEIKSKRQKIKGLEEEKEEVTKKIIGQMYNGVLISESLSIRKGEFFEYKCQYHPSIIAIKKKIMDNLHEVNDKLTAVNMDILEFCLEKIEDKEDTRNYYNNSNKDTITKNFDFDEIKLIEIRDDEVYEKNIKINVFNGVSLSDYGEITFYYKYNKEVEEYDIEQQKEIKEIKEIKENPSLKNCSQGMLYLKFEKEIEGLAKDFIVELDEKIRVKEEEIKEIKEKGSVQLMVCEISINNDNVNGYGSN